MRAQIKKFFSIVYFLGFCVSCQSAPNIRVTKISQQDFSNLSVPNEIEIPAEYRLAEDSDDEKKLDISFLAVQLDVEIAEPKLGEKYYDSILPNNFYSFIAYQAQADIFFDASGIESFICYINDIEIDTRKICSNVFAKVDISRLVKNGRNIIYVSNIIKKTENAKLAFRVPYPTLKSTKQHIEGVNYHALDFIDELLHLQIEEGFPSLQLCIVKDGYIIKNSSYGKIYNDEKFPQAALKTTTAKRVNKAPFVSNQSLYDLASNTKSFATLFAVQRLVFERKLSIHDKVKKFFPSFKDPKNARYTGKNEMTIEHLLCHSSGFPAGAAYYLQKDIKKANAKKRRELTLEKILETKLINDLGTKLVYSDINYMLLSFIVEKLSGLDFDVFLESKIYQPLGLDRICFKPLEHNFSLGEIAATDYTVKRSLATETYNGFAHGHVHDPEAFFVMDEVSGHAGLFANAESLAILAQTIINGGGYGTIRLFDKNTVSSFLAMSHYSPSFAMGWRAQNNDAYTWAFSTFASPQTVGHTGWTGTLTLLDPEKNVVIVILTNAKHSEYIGKQKSEGDYFFIRNYAALTSMIYSAFDKYDSKYYYSLLTEIAKKRFELLSTDKRFDNNGFYSDLNSIMKLIKKKSKDSQLLKDFLASKSAEEIEQTLTKKLK